MIITYLLLGVGIPMLMAWIGLYFIKQHFIKKRNMIEQNIKVGEHVRFFIVLYDGKRLFEKEGRVNWIDRDTQQCSVKTFSGIHIVDFKNVYQVG